MRRGTIVVLCLIVGLAILGGVLLAFTTPDPRPEPPSSATRNMSSELRGAVTAEGIMQHERRLQEIADHNGGNRAAGTPGYDASAEYVSRTLRKSGYDVTIQRFKLAESWDTGTASLQLTAPDAGEYKEGADFVSMAYSGSGRVTGKIVPVDAAEASTTSGCEAGDFGGFRAGFVALIRRGTCPFGQKASIAEAAGASAVLIFDTAPTNSGAFSGTLGRPGTGIPVLGTSFEAGQELLGRARDGGARVRISVRSASGAHTTSNVIAETSGDDAYNTVMVGAHLDSVPEGPGINDNGSGTSTILEIAEQMDRLGIKPRNKVRFAFWGAEELGLVGSRHYVEGLDGAELDDINAYLNFDMVGSPNYARFYYGSAEVTTVFEDYFTSRNLPSVESQDLTGRSDHGPFEDAGVPAGGLYSGAEGTKSGDQAKTYGGVPGEPYDACYHAACDDASNVDREALDEMSDATANAVAVFAQKE